MAMRVLVVKSQFTTGSGKDAVEHRRGHVIKDKALIDAILAGPSSVHVIQTDHADEKVEEVLGFDDEEV